MTRCVRFTVALAVASLEIAASGCAPRSASEDAGEPATASVAVTVRALEIREFARVVESTGRWRASVEFHIVSPFAATVESLKPRLGDAVTQGALIGRLVTRESQASLRGAELLLRQAETDEARADAARALALARHDLVKVPVIAGRSGTVSARAVEPGSEVAEGAELLTVVPSGSLVFEAHVPLAEAGIVRAGLRARIAMEDGSSIAATVQSHVPGTSAADQTSLALLAPVTPVPLELLERFGQAAIDTGERHRGIAVPDSAVAEDDLTGERRIAVVLPSGIAAWSTVRLGVAQAGWHELLEPRLPAGTRVVVSGQRGLPDSARVWITP